MFSLLPLLGLDQEVAFGCDFVYIRVYIFFFEVLMRKLDRIFEGFLEGSHRLPIYYPL